MTREEAIKELSYIADEMPSMECANWIEAINMAINALKQESVLDKIYADIQRLRGCSCSCSDGIIDDIEDILDKYRVESGET